MANDSTHSSESRRLERQLTKPTPRADSARRVVLMGNDPVSVVDYDTASQLERELAEAREELEEERTVRRQAESHIRTITPSAGPSSLRGKYRDQLSPSEEFMAQKHAPSHVGDTPKPDGRLTVSLNMHHRNVLDAMDGLNESRGHVCAARQALEAIKQRSEQTMKNCSEWSSTLSASASIDPRMLMLIRVLDDLEENGNGWNPATVPESANEAERKFRDMLVTNWRAIRALIPIRRSERGAK